MAQTSLKGAALIAFAALLWATTGIVAKFLFSGTELEAVTLGFLRLAIAMPLFFALMLREQRSLNRTGSSVRQGLPGLRGLLPLAALGVFQAFYQGSYLLAVDLTGAGIATLISLCVAPVLVAVLAIPLLGERPSLITVAALIAAIFGTSLLVISDMESTGELRLAGILTALLAALVYAGFTLTSRSNASHTPMFTTAFFCFLTAALVLLPVVWLMDGFAGLGTLAWWQWLMVGYVGGVPTCIGYLCFFAGMRSTPATLSSIIVTLEPLFVALLAWALLGEVFGVSGVIGALILTAAVIAADLRPESPRGAGQSYGSDSAGKQT